jgi:acyl-CoA synthetase (AMP-forming)/AMP-acid ligase II
MTALAETSVNVASHLGAMARRSPGKAAIVLSKRRGGRLRYSGITFAELDRETDAYARGLERIGVRRGTRTALMVPPGREFFALVFALFKVGATTVLIDPGVGKKNLLRCLAEIEPEAFIGIPLAHAARVLLRALPSVKINVTVGRRWFWGGPRLADLRDEGSYAMAPTRADEVAAILFTTGSTGIPKGAVYTHGIFDAQVRTLRTLYGIEADEIDLPTFPLFALFAPALGMTAVIPDMDATKPASVDPRNVIEAVREQGVTQMFGSPALLDTVSRFAAPRGEKLPTLRRVISAGAPVAPAILERFSTLLGAQAEIHTPYGATESLPVATIGSREILGETRVATARGEGTCVGKPAGEIEVRVIAISDAAIATWSDALLVRPGEVGELCVRGPVVTRSYFARPEQTALAKIQDGETFWHRMGDLGRQDERGRLWFYGRKAHRVETVDGVLYTDPCEAIVNEHPSVRRSALVGVGVAPRKRPVMVLELEPGKPRPDDAELRALARANPITRSLETFLVHEGKLPVDIRHNAKIFREKLAVWAESRLARG